VSGELMERREWVGSWLLDDGFGTIDGRSDEGDDLAFSSGRIGNWYGGVYELRTLRGWEPTVVRYTYLPMTKLRWTQSDLRQLALCALDVFRSRPCESVYYRGQDHADFGIKRLPRSEAMARSIL